MAHHSMNIESYIVSKSVLIQIVFWSIAPLPSLPERDVVDVELCMLGSEAR